MQRIFLRRALARPLVGQVPHPGGAFPADDPSAEADDDCGLKSRGPANLAGAWSAQPVPASPRPPRASSVLLVLTLVPAAVMSFISLFACRHIRNRRPGPFKAQRRRRDSEEVIAPVGEAADDDQELENRGGKDE